MREYKAVGADGGNGGGGSKNLYHTFISKGTHLCTLVYLLFPISTELRAFLALLLYTDLYVVILKLLDFFGWQNIAQPPAPPPPPPVPTVME